MNSDKGKPGTLFMRPSFCKQCVCVDANPQQCWESVGERWQKFKAPATNGHFRTPTHQWEEVEWGLCGPTHGANPCWEVAQCFAAGLCCRLLCSQCR